MVQLQSERWITTVSRGIPYGPTTVRKMDNHCIQVLILNILGQQRTIIEVKVKSHDTITILNGTGHTIILESITQEMGTNNMEFIQLELLNTFYNYYSFEDHVNFEPNQAQQPCLRAVCDMPIPEIDETSLIIYCKEANTVITMSLFFRVALVDTEVIHEVMNYSDDMYTAMVKTIKVEEN